jgi:hypothetical protein
VTEDEGPYVATLEGDKPISESLGVDASECGNEMRYINSYLNIDLHPNVVMKTGINYCFFKYFWDSSSV